MWMPVLVIGLVGSAATARMIRSTLLEVLHSDYIRTAWAKGLKERAVVSRHAIKNSLIPVVTIIGLQARTIIGGLVIIEVLFTIPGMGQLLVQSVTTRDLVPMQSVVLIFAISTILINLLVDISYSWLDPRIRQT
jgi:peptide/nickel transport system permease protein